MGSFSEINLVVKLLTHPEPKVKDASKMFYSSSSLWVAVWWLGLWSMPLCAHKRFSEWNLKNLRKKMLSLHNRLWYTILNFIWYTFPGVVSAVPSRHLYKWVSWFEWNKLVRLCESRNAWNMFWGRWNFLLLRRCSQSGFRKPPRTMCTGDVWFYALLNFAFIARIISSDRSLGFKSSDRNYYQVRRC